MKPNKYLLYLIPFFAVIIALVVAMGFNNYKPEGKSRSITPRHWLADLQYTHIAIVENFQTGNGTFLSPKTYNLDPKGGGGYEKIDGSADARFPVLDYFVSVLASDQKEQIAVWRVFSLSF